MVTVILFVCYMLVILILSVSFLPQQLRLLALLSGSTLNRDMDL